MKFTLFTIFVLALTCVNAQQQPSKPEPAPSAEHSPGNPPLASGGAPPQTSGGIPPPAAVPVNNSNLNTNSTNSGAGGNVQTNQSVPKPENSPKAEPAPGESKPKAEPAADHEHDHDHEHSPGNPKHLDHMGGGVEHMKPTQFLLVISALLMTMFAL